jgi:two-component system cell cycle sensor histidine kinase/response regulator CckA
MLNVSPEDSAIKILVIDDKQDNLISARAVIRDAFPGADVFTALDGPGGIGLAVEKDPDVILLDVVMPEMDGFEVCRRLKLDPRVRDIPVVILTASTGRQVDRIRALENGAEGFLSKPMNESDMTALIRAMVKVKSAERQKHGENERLAVLVAERTRALEQNQATMLNLLNDLQAENMAHLKTEAALRESESRYSQLAEQSRTITWEVDVDGLYTYVSPVAERVWGYGPDELAGRKSFCDLHPEEGRDAFKAAVFPVLARKAPFLDLENAVQAKDGRIVWVSTTGIPVTDANGQWRGYRGVDTDITMRKEAQVQQLQLTAQLQQAQKLEAIGQLAGGVAHDFNNLLTGIMGYVDLCRDHVGPDHAIRSWLDEVVVEIKRSSAITRQLLTFARKQAIAPVTMDLKEAVVDTLKMLRRLTGENIKIAWLPSAEPLLVQMDPSHIDQILANLVVNARDAIGGGAGKVTIGASLQPVDAAYCVGHADATAGEYVMLSVSDTGCGMDKATIAHIFEPFFTTKETGKGTGLGLATVYGIVKQANGFLTVYSEPGKGTTFKIHLPSVAAAPAEAPVAAAAPAALVGGTETILVVEDEKSIRITIQAFLKRLGYSVRVAETPAQALQLMQKYSGEIRLMITDVILPGMSGPELVQQMAALYPGMRRIFMSGYPADVIARHGVVDYHEDFLPKPFTRRQLVDKVRVVLDRP